MPNHEALKSLSADALWEFQEWVAFGHGRYVGIRIEPRSSFDTDNNRIRFLAEAVCRAIKQPDDAALCVAPPMLEESGDDVNLVAAITQYVAARHVALYREAADFLPQHAVDVQARALHRVQERLGNN